MEVSSIKTKTTFLTFSITALILAIILIVLGVYYAAGALIVGMLIVGHREIWSLIRTGKLPPIDERVKENANKSIRNSFIFFGVVSIHTILFYFTDDQEINQYVYPPLEYFLSGLLLSVGIVYMLSYLFYDRVEANLGRKGLRILKIFLLVAGISLMVFIFNFFFINAVFPTTDFTFHRIMLYTTPFIFALGIVISMIIFLKGLFARP